MWAETPVFQQDLERLCGHTFIPWERLSGKTILVTGATGLIGTTLIHALLFCNEKKGLNLRVLALVRNLEKARERFAPGGALELIEGDVTAVPRIVGPVDYLIHGASPTASRYFVEHPVETVRTAVGGTCAMLELAREKQAQGFVYLSSMEAYGAPKTSALLQETDVDYLNPLLIRSCYPESKRMCENLCAGYASEYGVPAVIARLSQTFGPGVPAEDGRVFAEFSRNALAHRDIVLKTKGDSERTYVYTMDAVSAILTLLLKGVPGQAYNVANSETYCSVLEMAHMVARVFGGKDTVVRIEESDSGIYPPAHCYHLCAEKLEALGWKPTANLEEMYRRMILSQYTD